MLGIPTSVVPLLRRWSQVFDPDESLLTEMLSNGLTSTWYLPLRQVVLDLGVSSTTDFNRPHPTALSLSLFN